MFIYSVPFLPENTVPASKPEWYTPCSTSEQIPGHSGVFRLFRVISGKYQPKLWIQPEWVSCEKKLKEYKEKSYELLWGGKIKGRIRRWEEKNQEKKKKQKEKEDKKEKKIQEKLTVMRFIIYVWLYASS